MEEVKEPSIIKAYKCNSAIPLDKRMLINMITDSGRQRRIRVKENVYQ